MEKLELMMCNKNCREKDEPLRGLFTNFESFMDNGNVIVYYDEDEIAVQILNYESEMAKEIKKLCEEW